MGHIYIIQSKLDDRVYVGQASNPNERWRHHKYAARKRPSQYIHNAMAKYGIDNFTFQVIETWETDEDTNEAEVFWIQFFRSRERGCGFNRERGGSMSTPEARARHAEVMREYYASPVGLAQREKFRAQYRGQKLPAETRAKMKISNSEKNAKITREDVQRIKKLNAEGVSTREIMARFPNIKSRSSIRNIVNGVTWRHL